MVANIPGRHHVADGAEEAHKRTLLLVPGAKRTAHLVRTALNLCLSTNVYWLITATILAPSNLFFEKLLKLLQLFLVNVGNSPVVQVRVYPV